MKERQKRRGEGELTRNVVGLYKTIFTANRTLFLVVNETLDPSWSYKMAIGRVKF